MMTDIEAKAFVMSLIAKQYKGEPKDVTARGITLQMIADIAQSNSAFHLMIESRDEWRRCARVLASR